MWIIGMMSGTSADGIDAALVEISGAPSHLSVAVRHHHTSAHPEALRVEIFKAFRPETSSAARISALNVALGEAFAQAALELIDAARVAPEEVDLIASHGQVVWYEPPGVLTLADPAVIAERTGITTISHFRERDLAAGGRGAPLVSYLDWLLFRHAEQNRALQNIGGIGNLTALPALNNAAAPLTFDTGPGNMIMDYCVQQATNGAQKYDLNGTIAASGQVDAALLAELMATPYIQQAPPKTTGRELFGVQFAASVWERGQALGLDKAGIIATVTAFTAESIAHSVRAFVPFPIHALYLAGGGAFNRTLRRMIMERLPGVYIGIHDELGIRAAEKECVLFAVLGYETWHGRPGTLPVFTGAYRPTVLGSITPGRNWRGLTS
jgi:anhydro-N-acetylmuramic acid kinase